MEEGRRTKSRVIAVVEWREIGHYYRAEEGVVDGHQRETDGAAAVESAVVVEAAK